MKARATARLGKLGVVRLSDNRQINFLEAIDELFPQFADVGFEALACGTQRSKFGASARRADGSSYCALAIDKLPLVT